MKSFEKAGTQRWEDLGFEALESDPEYGQILQEAALEFLRQEDKGYFEREFTGELDEKGYLIPKDGRRGRTKPSQNIGGGRAMERVLEITMAKLAGS